ncbi:MAG: hypothetical protein H7836_12605 [Magnetococcus sp. YQC-3]
MFFCIDGGTQQSPNNGSDHSEFNTATPPPHSFSENPKTSYYRCRHHPIGTSPPTVRPVQDHLRNIL